MNHDLARDCHTVDRLFRYAFALFSYQCKNNRNLFRVQLVSYVFYTAYLMLWGRLPAASALTWNGWISLLPVAANIATTLPGYTNDPRKICLVGPLIQFAPMDRLQRLFRFPGGHSG